MADYTPYSTAVPLLGPLPTWLNSYDAARVSSYALYDQMYWNVPDTYKLTQRGSDKNPIYVPSARVIINAVNRFLAKDFDFVLDPAVGTPEDRLLVGNAMRTLFAREGFRRKFGTQKRAGLIRGDAIWHIVADPARPAGRRLSIYEIDPGMYFPIVDPDNLDRVIGCHLVEQFTENGKTLIRRQTYLKSENGRITSELNVFESGKWDDREGQDTKLVRAEAKTELPPEITALPVYHIRNSIEPGNPFGSSELRGLEIIAARVNQTISDEDVALALEGLGLYYTTSGPPRDEDGNETDWILGPGRVVEIDPESEFGRVTGVSSVSSSQDHADWLLAEMRRSIGVPDVAVGMVDVAIAQSGIALSLQMSPLLASCADKEEEMLEVYDHMLFDIVNGWLPAYEGIRGEVGVGAVVGDAMPVDKDAFVDRVIKLVTAGLASAEWARAELASVGIVLPGTEGDTILAEKEALSRALSNDVYSERIRAELDTLLTEG